MNILTVEDLLASIDHVSHSVLFLDSSGNFIAFYEEPQIDNACRVIVNWKNIQLRNKVDAAKLEELVKACIHFNEVDALEFPPPLMVKTDTGQTIYIDAVPIPARYSNAMGQAKAILHIRGLGRQGAVSRKILQQTYHMTPAEASLAVALVAGRQLKDVARKNGVSIWTVRSQLRAVFQKTNTHRQAELVSILAGTDSTHAG